MGRFSIETVDNIPVDYAHPIIINPVISSRPIKPLKPVKSVLAGKGMNGSKIANTGVVYSDAGGFINIEIKELERLTIQLWGDKKKSIRNSLFNAQLPSYCRNVAQDSISFEGYQGYLRVGDRLRPLPIGSTLDTEKGLFYWQPGPGFVGDYEFIFIIGQPSGEPVKKIIAIKIGN
ncbi:MAG: hypothetical protein GY757_32270 [bacterium]|nr:hypothetical protein [bacterium]